MALIDVSELLSDSDFVDDITVLRPTRSVNNVGRTVDVPGAYYTYGCVQPAREAQLVQIPEMERIGSFISILTPFRLRALTDTTAPDQVMWDGQYYQVRIVRDWTNYGEGFVEAVCELTGTVQAGPP